MREILKRAAAIELIIFDVDGVLTDGSLYLGDDGQEYKAFNSKDGHGMKMLQESGVEIAIITGRSSQVVATRMESLGIHHVYQGQHDKVPAYRDLIEKLALEPEQVAYVGDDIVDLPIMTQVGLSIAVRDAHKLVKQHANWQSEAKGGRGAAREVCELIMQAKGSLETMHAKYL